MKFSGIAPGLRLIDTRHKYHARRVEIDNISFASQKEANRYLDLKLAERAGQIKDLKLQPAFILQPNFTDRAGNKHRAITYRADFQYTENDRVIVEDTKGYETEIWKLKKKMFLYHFPEYELRIT